MRSPPPFSELPYFPVTGGILLLAIVASAARFMHYDTAPLEMNYLAFHGQPWRLITSAFPHLNVLHLLFNAYWIWVFGSIIEQRFKSLRTAALYAFLAVGSAGAEYAFATGGVGLSGVGYGLFGFLWVLSRSDRSLKDAVDSKTTQLFVIWFFICIALTVTHAMGVANYAHGFGAILGALTGWIVEKRRGENAAPLRIPAAAGMILLLAGIAWAATAGRPLVNFSRDGGDDVAQLGYEALMRDDNQRAAHLLEIATSMRHPDPGWSLNLGIAYERLGREKESAALFRKAAKAGVLDGDGHRIDVR